MIIKKCKLNYAIFIQTIIFLNINYLKIIMVSSKNHIKSFEILKKVNTKSKPNISKISKELGITRQTFQNKFEMLKDKGIIKNFTININPNIRPNLKYVILEIKTNPKEPHIVEDLLKIPQMKMLDGIFGEYSLIALFVFNDSEEFNKVLLKVDEIMGTSYFKKYQIIEAIKVFKTNGIDVTATELEIDLNIDQTDYNVLKIMENEQNLKLISTYEISKIFKKRYNVELSQSTIYNRIKRLEESSVILNYSINFKPKKVGFKGKFIVRIKPKDSSKYSELALSLVRRDEIVYLFRMGEQYGLLAIVRVKKIEDFGDFIKNLYESEDMEDTYTNFVLDELKPYTNFKLF